jgi:hypothetical protein
MSGHESAKVEGMLTAAFSSAKVVTTAAPRTQPICRGLTSSMLTYLVQRHTTAQFADRGHETKGRRAAAPRDGADDVAAADHRAAGVWTRQGVITRRLCAVPRVRRDRGTAQFRCKIYAAWWWSCHGGVCGEVFSGSR